MNFSKMAGLDLKAPVLMDNLKAFPPGTLKMAKSTLLAIDIWIRIQAGGIFLILLAILLEGNTPDQFMIRHSTLMAKGNIFHLKNGRTYGEE